MGVAEVCSTIGAVLWVCDYCFRIHWMLYFNVWTFEWIWVYYEHSHHVHQTENYDSRDHFGGLTTILCCNAGSSRGKERSNFGSYQHRKHPVWHCGKCRGGLVGTDNRVLSNAVFGDCVDIYIMRCDVEFSYEGHNTVSAGSLKSHMNKGIQWVNQIAVNILRKCRICIVDPAQMSRMVGDVFSTALERLRVGFKITRWA